VRERTKQNSTNTFQVERCICTAIARAGGRRPCGPPEPYELLTNTECNVPAVGSRGRGRPPLRGRCCGARTEPDGGEELVGLSLWLLFPSCRRFATSFFFRKMFPPAPAPRCRAPPCPGRSEELSRPEARRRRAVPSPGDRGPGLESGSYKSSTKNKAKTPQKWTRFSFSPSVWMR